MNNKDLDTFEAYRIGWLHGYERMDKRNLSDVSDREVTDAYQRGYNKGQQVFHGEC